MPRVLAGLGIVTGIVLSGGCAYFHPAFVTNPQAAQSENGVLVCERQSLTRSNCAVVSHQEISRLLSETTARY
jgi:hypothetical protein